MKARDIWPGDSTAITIDRFREDDRPVTLQAGPVEGVLFIKLGQLPPGTILFGHIWTEEPEVVVRYHEAIDASGTRFPFCAVAIDGLDGLVKLPGSAPGQAVLRDAQSALWVVDTFRDNASLLEDTRAQLFR